MDVLALEQSAEASATNSHSSVCTAVFWAILGEPLVVVSDGSQVGGDVGKMNHVS